MPRLRSRKKFTATDVVEVIEAHAVQLTHMPAVYIAGTRLRGDHEAVQLNPQFFAIAGSPSDEIDAQRRELYAVERHEEPVEIRKVKIAKRVPDERAVIAKWRVGGVRPGEIVDSRDPLVTENKDSFAPMVPHGLTRENSYRATSSMTHERDGVERTIYGGQWVSRDDELVKLHPALFEQHPIEADTDDDA